MKRMHDYAPEYRPSEEEQRDIRGGAGCTGLVVTIIVSGGYSRSSGRWVCPSGSCWGSSPPFGYMNA